MTTILRIGGQLNGSPVPLDTISFQFGTIGYSVSRQIRPLPWHLSSDRRITRSNKALLFSSCCRIPIQGAREWDKKNGKRKGFWHSNQWARRDWTSGYINYSWAAGWLLEGNLSLTAMSNRFVPVGLDRLACSGFPFCRWFVAYVLGT